MREALKNLGWIGSSPLYCQPKSVSKMTKTQSWAFCFNFKTVVFHFSKLLIGSWYQIDLKSDNI